MPVKPRALIATIAVAVAISLFSLVAAPLLSLVPADAAYAQEGPSVEITFDPEGTVVSGTEIGFTVTFSGLTATSGLQWRANVVGGGDPDRTACEGSVAFDDMASIGTITDGTASTTGTIKDTCPAGLSILVASLHDSDGVEIISTAKGFVVTAVKKLSLRNAITRNDVDLLTPNSVAGLWGEMIAKRTRPDDNAYGTTDLHVVDSASSTVYVYELPVYDYIDTDYDDRNRLIFRKIYHLAATTRPWGIVASQKRGIMWVSDDRSASGTASKIIEYRKSGDQLTVNREISLTASSTSPKGIHFTGDIYVVDSEAHEIFGYVVQGNSRTLETYVLTKENADPTGIWASGDIMWVADVEDEKLYAYDMYPTQDHLPESDVNGITGNPAGVWSDYSQIYVLDSVSLDIFGYKMPSRKYSPHIITGRSYVEYPENSTDDVGTYEARDPEDRNVDWSLHPAGDSEHFRITHSGKLYFKQPPDFEGPKDKGKDNEYHLIITASSGEFAHSYFPVRVEVTDVLGEQPMFIDTSTTRTVEENTPAGEKIGAPVVAVNPDKDPIHIYSLSGGDAASFDFSTSTGQIITKAALDFESKASYSVTVSIRDSENEDGSTSTSTDADDSIAVTIQVTNVSEGTTGGGNPPGNSNPPGTNNPNVNNEPRFTGNFQRSIEENTGPDQKIGDPVTATDDDDPLEYSLKGTNSGMFEIDPSTGQLKTKASLNHEDQSSYTVEVTATDPADASDETTVTIDVTNVNEPPTVTGPTNVDYVEGSSGPVATYTVTDPDPEGIRDIEWDTRGVDGSRFRFSGTELHFNATPDYESPLDSGGDNVYNITVEADDKSGGTDSIDVTVRVTGVNDSPRFPSSDTRTRSVTENTPAGQPVGAPVAATDAEGDTLHYTLGGTNKSHFDFNSSTGQILVKGDLNYESKRSYSVTVSVRDSKNADGTADTATDDTINITINVLNVDEAPGITGSTSETFPENGTRAVATYTGRDPEQGTVTWTLLGTDGGDFAISSGGVLSFDPAPDYENPKDSNADNVYNVTVQASDGRNNNNSLEVSVTVSNVEEVGKVTLSSVQPQVSSPLTASLSDPDVVTSAIIWSWHRSTSSSSWSAIGNATANSYTPVSGDVNYYLRATASYTDRFNSSNKSARAVSQNPVRVFSEDNTPPSYSNTQTSRSVEENTAAGTNVGAPVTATDQGDTLTYRLQGTGAATFRIVASSGQIQTRAPLDYETRSSYVVTVKAIDPSSASSTVTVNISVTNVDEPPVAVDDTATATEDGSAIAIDVLANDSDPEGEQLTLTSTTQPANGSAVVANGMVTYTPNAGYYGSDQFTYTVSDGTLSSTGNVYVSVAASGDPTVENATIPIQFVPINGGGERILLSDYFSDPDAGYPPYQATTSDSSIATVEVSEGYLSITPVGTGVATTTLTVSDTPRINQEFKVVVYRPVVPRTDTETVHIVDPDTATTLTTADGKLSVEFQAGSRDRFFQAAIDAQSESCGLQAPVGERRLCVLVDLFDLGAQSIEESLNHTATMHVMLDQAMFDAVQTDIASGEFSVWKGHGPGNASWEPLQQCPDPVGQDECYKLIASENGEGGKITVFNISGFSQFAAGFDESELPPAATPAPPSTGGSGGSGGSGGGHSTSSGRSTDDYEYKGNQTPQIFGRTEVTYAENGTEPIAEFIAKDPDDDDITWSLLGYDRREFEISNKGVLSFRSPPDYENPEGREGNTYWVIIQAEDDGRPSEYDVHNVRVTVTQVNELGAITGDSELSLPENQTDMLSQYQVDDPEEGVITWTLSGPDASGFEIDDQGNLMPAGALDFESPSSSAETNVHTLTITATDNGKPELSAEFEVSVTISNVNEAPQVGEIPNVDLSTRHLPWMLNLAEFFTDPDGDSLSYEISGPASTDVAHAAVDSGTLTITPAGDGTTSFYVVAGDSDGLSVVGKVAVSVTEPEPAPTPAPVKVTAPVPISTPAPVVVVETVPPPVAPQPPEPQPVVAPEPSPTHVPLWLLSERRWRNLAQQPDKLSKLIATFKIEPQSAPMAELLLPLMVTPVPPKYVTPMDDIAAGNGPGPLWVASGESGGLSIWLIMLLVLIAMVTAGYAVRMYVIHRL